MSTRPLSKVLAVMTAIVLIAPSVFLVTPPRAHAAVAILPLQVSQLVEDALTVAKTTITAVNSVTSAAADYALYIQQYVLEPMAFALSGRLVQSITGGIVRFINGENGTGQSQFVRNLQGYQQTLGDSQAAAFFFQFGKNSNSPFARSINSSLRTNYLQQTSLAGFFAGNRNTLPQFARNQNAYLAGRWSEGGAAAWFALTTQDQNNPYTLHRRAQYELALMVQDKTAAGLNDYITGGGFISWCGGTAPTVDTPSCDPNLQSCGAETNKTACDPTVQSCEGAGNVAEEGPTAPRPSTLTFGNKSVNPGDACTNSDGTPGTIQTPGSTIKGVLDKALGLNADKAVSLGNPSAQITNIIGNLTKIVSTATFANQLIGSASVSGVTAGLAGSTESSGSNRSFLYEYENSPGAFGFDESNVVKDTSKSDAVSGKQLLDNVDQYEAAWNIISGAATNANGSVNQLLSTCTAAGDTIRTITAQNALTKSVAPVLAKVAAASTTISKARNLVDRIQAEANSTAPGAGGRYAADVQLLQSMPPSASDIAYAEKQAGDRLDAVARPEGWLTISGGTLVTQMNLMAENAHKLRQSCLGFTTATSTTP